MGTPAMREMPTPQNEEAMIATAATAKNAYFEEIPFGIMA